MKKIRLLVYVLLCSSNLTEFIFAGATTDKQKDIAACPTSPVYKKDLKQVISPIQEETENQTAVDHGTTPINASIIVVIFSGSPITKTSSGFFPSYPSLDRLDAAAHKTLSSTFSAEELGVLPLSEKKQHLGNLHPNTSAIFDHATTPVSPKRK